MFRKIIAKLYNKYCKQEIKTLYIQGIQRHFDNEWDLAEKQLVENTCRTFVNDGVCKLVFDRILKEYVEVLFNLGETQEVRDVMFNNINVILKAEAAIKAHAVEEPKNTQDAFVL